MSPRAAGESCLAVLLGLIRVLLPLGLVTAPFVVGGYLAWIRSRRVAGRARHNPTRAP